MSRLGLESLGLEPIHCCNTVSYCSSPGSPAQQPISNLSYADLKQQYAVLAADAEISECSLEVLNEKRFCALRPLGRHIFTAPASSAASERVFSKAGLIMRPTRSRLSKVNLAKLVFVSCNTAGPGVWNGLPLQLRQRDVSFERFRKLLKTFLFRWWGSRRSETSR
jgi:hypothetical protein